MEGLKLWMRSVSQRAWVHITSLAYQLDSDNINQFSFRCPPKFSNHIYWHWSHTEFMKRICWRLAGDWLKRNDMNYLFRICWKIVFITLDNALFSLQYCWCKLFNAMLYLQCLPPQNIRNADTHPQKKLLLKFCWCLYSITV